MEESVPESGSYEDWYQWKVYTEMLEIVDDNLDTEGYQSRFIERAERPLLRDIQATDITKYYPFLVFCLDPENREEAFEETVNHEVAHLVLGQIINDYFPELIAENPFKNLEQDENSSDGYFLDKEKAAQKLESFYAKRSDFLEDLGIKEDIRDEIEQHNDHSLAEDESLDSIFRSR